MGWGEEAAEGPSFTWIVQLLLLEGKIHFLKAE